jgi:broad specificity phosphatase PhoE
MEQGVGGKKKNLDNKSMFELIFLRHAESVGNAGGYYQGQHDFPLTEDGKDQARALAARWEKEGKVFDHIISSPLSRTKETAEIVNTNLNCPISFNPIWMERDAGKLAGVKHADAHKVHPRPKFIPLYEPVGETGESEWDLYLRAGKAIQSILTRPPGKYLIVSHGGLLNKVLNAALGIPLQSDFRGIRYRFGNVGFAKFTYIPSNNQWWVWAINDQEHLKNPQIQEWEYLFTLLRHGKADGRPKKQSNKQREFSLHPDGEKEVISLVKYWENRETQFDQIISSPQKITRETAGIISKAFNLPLTEEAIWNEIDDGEPEGPSANGIKEGLIQRFNQNNPFLPFSENGESWWDVYLRSGQALKSLMERPPGKYLIVSHSTTLNWLLYSILGIYPQAQQCNPLFHFRTTSYVSLGYRSDRGSWYLTRTGDQSHLNL